MQKLKAAVGVVLSLLIALPPQYAFASSHREAPITALDHAADITDWYAFVSYDHPDRVTFIMNVDPFLQPSNGPNFFPFDPNILYEMRIDYSHKAYPDVVFQFRFTTTINDPGLFLGFAGAGGGINAPANSPAPVAPGTPIVPPAITSLSGSGAAGLSLQQTYTVTMVRGDKSTELTNMDGTPLFAVPTNIGPRTMPNYSSLAQQGVYSLQAPGVTNVRAFAGTVADPFFIDLGATFDSINFRPSAGGGVVSATQDANDQLNTAPNSVAGFNVNTIALEVPITMLTEDGKLHPANDPLATIGTWAATFRPEVTVRRVELEPDETGPYFQVQRLGNPLINELIIGTGSKDAFSLSQPMNDSQFASFGLDPLLARIVNAVYGINIPTPPRTDLLTLFQYEPPIAAASTPKGPVSDMLRLNTGVPPTPLANRKRLGLIAGDGAGWPNGRRLTDDVVDIALRVVAGGVLVNGFNVAPNNMLGDGVNAPDVPTQETFPYVHWAYSGRDSRHVDPSEVGCGNQPNSTSPQNSDAPPANQGGAATCPVN